MLKISNGRIQLDLLVRNDSSNFLWRQGDVNKVIAYLFKMSNIIVSNESEVIDERN